MSRSDIEIVREYLTDDEPFGPIDATEIEDRRAIGLLFERHNKIYGVLHKRPSLVVGRKGSGKTSYLNSVHFDSQYKYVAAVNASEAFTSVVTAVSKGTTGAVFAEQVARIWENVLQIGLFCDIRGKLPRGSQSKKLIDDYLAKIGIREGATLDDALWSVADVIAEQAKGRTTGIVADILRRLDSTTHDRTRNALSEELKSTKTKAVILLDSLDDFQLHMDDVGRALQGLLKLAGEWNKPSSRIDMRLCLPAELYHRFVAISSNPTKDLRRELVLHWVASELIAVAGHRAALYQQSRDGHLSGPEDSRAALQKMLPHQVTSKVGTKEDSLSYILRHTQLLPRQLLMLLNSIHAKNRRAESRDPLRFTEESIRDGISAVEATIVQEILAAFRPVYPAAKAVCEACIPELFTKFSIGDLERVFRSHGKKAMETNDFFDFKRLLLEIGAVGRVVSETDLYVKGLFEYTLPHKLVSGTDDLLCIHPLFTEVFSAKIREKKPVYPYGASLDDQDYRER